MDPTAFVEIDFEAEVVKALTCLFSDYWCGVFAGTFLLGSSLFGVGRLGLGGGGLS